MKEEFIKKEKEKFNRALKYLIIMWFIVAIIFGGYSFLDTTETCHATIIKKHTNKFIITYSVNDTQYINTVENTNNNLHVGDPLEIKYKTLYPRILVKPITKTKIILNTLNYLIAFIVPILFGKLLLKKRIDLINEGLQIEAELFSADAVTYIYRWFNSVESKEYYFKIKRLISSNSEPQKITIILDTNQPQNFIAIK